MLIGAAERKAAAEISLPCPEEEEEEEEEEPGVIGGAGVGCWCCCCCCSVGMSEGDEVVGREIGRVLSIVLELLGRDRACEMV